MSAVIAAVCAVLLLLTGCGVAQGSDELTIYSGRSRDLVEPLLNRFAESTGIRIAVRYGDSTDLALLLTQEGARSPADVFLTQSPGTVGFLATDGLLSDVPPGLLQQVPQEHSGDQWVGVTARQRVAVYNTEMLAEGDLPESVLDLTGPSYRGKVALAPSNASFQDFITAMRLELGDDVTQRWLEQMAANEAAVYANNNAIVEAVSRGEIPMGLVNHYYNERFLAEDPSLPSRNARFRDGDIGNLVIQSAATILRSTDQPSDAEEFIAYLLSEAAQHYFAEETFEYPLAAGVQPVGDLPPLEASRGPGVDVDTLGDGFRDTQRMIDASGIAS